MIWFVNNAGANGDGRLATPFSSLANFNSGAADEAGDIIFVYQGSGYYSGGVTLLNNQQLIGQGVVLATVTGITVPTGSTALPGATANPVFVNADTIVTLPGSSGVSTIRGVTLNPSSGSAIAGNGSGATTVANVSLNPSGTGSGISLTSLAGAFTATSCPVTANSSGAALVVSGGSQTISFDSASAISQSGAARVADIQSRTGGTVTLAGNLSATGSSTGILAQNNSSGTIITFSGTTKTLNTGSSTAVTLASNTGATVTFSGGGLNVDTTLAVAFSVTGGGTVNVSGSGNTIDSTSVTAFLDSGTGGSATIDINAALANTTGRLIDIQNRAVNVPLTLSGNLRNGGTGILVNNNTAGTITFSGGTKTLNTGGNTAVTLTSNAGGTITFSRGGLNVDTTTATAFSVTGGGAVNVTGLNNFIDSTSGTTFLNSGTGGSANISINAVMTGTIGRLLDIQNRAVNVPLTLSGNLNSTGTGIIGTNNTAGTITLSGTTKTLNTGANTAVALTNNTGATFTFSNGGLVITTSTGTGLSATNGGTINVSVDGGANNTINSSGATAIIENGVTNSATFASVTSGGGANNISLTSLGGTLTMNGGSLSGSISGAGNHAFLVSGSNAAITYAGAVTKANAGALLNVAGGHSGTLTFNTGTLNANAGTGLQFDDADGTYNFNGPTTLNGGDAGVDILNGCGGTFIFGTGAAITSPSGIAFNVDGGVPTSTCNVTYNGNITQANNAAMVNVRNHNTGTITFQTGTLTASSGTGLQFDNCDSTTSYNFNGTVTLSGGDAGIDIITGSAGNFTFSSGTSITSPSGVAFLVNGGTGNIDYNGTISKTSDGKAIDVQSHTGGTVSFDGTVSSTSLSDGINLQNNTGGTINFTAALTLNTSSSGTTGFNAIGGGTVSATASGSTINSGTGAALNVVNTTIGASGLIFRSISANAASSGIVLNNTGVSGGLSVTGSGNTSVGGDNSGGTIQNTTSHGISLTSTMNPSFVNMNIHDIARNGIDGTSVTNFTFQNGKITNTGTAAAGQYEENGIAFVDRVAPFTDTTVKGNVNITGNTITQPHRNGIDIEIWNDTISNLNISNNTLSGGTTTASILHAILVLAQGSATTTANITTGTIQNNIISGFRFFNVPNNFYIGGSGIFIAGGNTENTTSATLGAAGTPIVISGNDVDNVGDSFIKATFNGRLGTSSFWIHDNGTVANPMTNAEGVGLSVFFGGNPSTGNADNFKAVIDHNVLDLNNRAGSSGLAVQMDNGGNTADAPKVSADINNNTIKHEAGSGIVAIGINDAGTMFVKVNDNHVLDKPTSSAGYGIRISENSVGPIINLEMHGNDTVGGGVFTAGGIGLRKAGSTQFGIEGLPAGSVNSPGPENYVNSQNPAAGGTELISATTGFSNQNVP